MGLGVGPGAQVWLTLCSRPMTSVEELPVPLRLDTTLIGTFSQAWSVSMQNPHSLGLGHVRDKSDCDVLFLITSKIQSQSHIVLVSVLDKQVIESC